MSNLQVEKERFSKFLMEQMFSVKAGESVVISADVGSDRELVLAMMDAAQAAGGKAFVVYVPLAEYDGQAGMKVWAAAPLTAALCQVDIWIDAQSVVMLYSEIWEQAMVENDHLRYLVIGDTGVESLVRTFMSFDIPTLKALLQSVRAMVLRAKRVTITSQNGTDISYEINLNYAFDYDDGDYSEPKFGTAPGYLNIVPKKESMNGKIVFDELMYVEMTTEDRVTFEMRDGIIKEVTGSKAAAKYREFLASFNDPNMYKISHNMLGMNPGVRVLTGNIVEDERIWGGVDFGFGHTSPMDMPPDGQQAKSHFDGVVERVNVFLDDVQIFKNGEICHPDLVDLADKLL